MKYIYTDYSDNTTFECEAADILAADKLYQAASRRMNVTPKGKLSIPTDVTTWSPDWVKKIKNSA